MKKAVIYSKASPKAISERTSYLRVRLEFLRYPHLIRDVYKRQFQIRFLDWNELKNF